MSLQGGSVLFAAAVCARNTSSRHFSKSVALGTPGHPLIDHVALVGCDWWIRQEPELDPDAINRTAQLASEVAVETAPSKARQIFIASLSPIEIFLQA